MNSKKTIKYSANIGGKLLHITLEKDSDVFFKYSEIQKALNDLKEWLSVECDISIDSVFTDNEQ